MGLQAHLLAKIEHIFRNDFMRFIHVSISMTKILAAKRHAFNFHSEVQSQGGEVERKGVRSSASQLA